MHGHELQEPRTVDDVLVRMGRPRQQWESFADELKAQQRGLHHRLGHHGVTAARDNFLNRRDRDGF
jgi:hypothetical protein